MTPDRAANERADLRSRVKFLKLCLVFTLGTIVLGLILVMFLVLRDPTRIVPPEIQHAYVIGSGTANGDYLSDMSDYVLSLQATTTPETVDHNNAVILKMTDPAAYPVIKTMLDAAAIRIKRERITTIFVMRTKSIDRPNNRVITTGTFKTYIGDKLVGEEDRSLLVAFNITLTGQTYVQQLAQVDSRGNVVPNSGR
ncbi:TraE/TraK family type IV conjugative transfer system protein [Burkholderia cenocepacia]|uniref:TraE conjugative transfer protein n=4 Tax=Burkholderia cenocepacia TaxID=95486 RepID=B4EQI4_BURCJ|nr:TraE/TraK family type IV conjugative transfer system protein [Burkholderia cenocepacia]KIS46033.1 traE family protein [Burkholderia cepacia]EPZ84547.1 putative type IV conjugative transfer system protein TraE [Burkholderia cenocepacia K56-2Valvano]ERI28601.1 putative type IV conjugative transfer system protein TraE [Burkholderia cenocepacia BC7]KKI81700.1 conjugal transfer protein TraE [Burkholderia cenocepacia]ONR58995.1 conjugal transfer protein TraE [Burkholderia cenocepacia]